MAGIQRIRAGTLVPRDDGKRIEEFVGAAHTGTRSMSIARMLAPPGWREPPQTPSFDESVIVLRGTLTLVEGRRRERIGAGEVGFVPRGTTVVYRNDGEEDCEYLSVCAPAFRPKLAGMAPSSPVKGAPVVEVRAEGARAQPFVARIDAEARHFLHQLKVRNVELSVLLVGDAAIRKLNRTWRQKDKATDVLSFPAGDVPEGIPGPKPLGDVIISVETAARVAKADGRTVEAELSRYLAHGILHLLGYDHERGPKDARKMAALEERLLGGAGLIPERGEH